MSSSVAPRTPPEPPDELPVEAAAAGDPLADGSGDGCGVRTVPVTDPSPVDGVVEVAAGVLAVVGVNVLLGFTVMPEFQVDDVLPDVLVEPPLDDVPELGA